LARSFRPAGNSATCLHVMRIWRDGAGNDLGQGDGRSSSSIVGFAFVRPACLPALPRANTFFLNSHSCHISLLHCCALFISPHNFTHCSISLFNSLRLGLGRFTRFPTRRLPAFHCQYHFPPTSKRYESRSRAPWPYISITNMSSSEDDKPLVKGLYSLLHARVCLVRSGVWLS
jgi:hypothetical protein